jgi:hypothetical protein
LLIYKYSSGSMSISGNLTIWTRWRFPAVLGGMSATITQKGYPAK